MIPVAGVTAAVILIDKAPIVTGVRRQSPPHPASFTNSHRLLIMAD